jgi:hypothetical protein
MGFLKIKKKISETNPDIVYSISMNSNKFVVLWLIFDCCFDCLGSHHLVAPNGERCVAKLNGFQYTHIFWLPVSRDTWEIEWILVVWMFVYSSMFAVLGWQQHVFGRLVSLVQDGLYTVIQNFVFPLPKNSGRQLLRKFRFQKFYPKLRGF